MDESGLNCFVAYICVLYKRQKQCDKSLKRFTKAFELDNEMWFACFGMVLMRILTKNFWEIVKLDRVI